MPSQVQAGWTGPSVPVGPALQAHQPASCLHHIRLLWQGCLWEDHLHGGPFCEVPMQGLPRPRTPPHQSQVYPVLCGSSGRFRTAHEAAGQLRGSVGLGKLGTLSHLPAAGPGVASVPWQPLSAVPVGMTVLHVMFSESGDSGRSPGLRTVTSSSLPRSIGQNAPQQDQPRFGSGTCPSSLNGEL